ncbi:hypothetical protein ACGFJC_47065 [Nonomuraea fuscirosea]|uniref:hypothetical protein n=1 Tax=Nonomuraea fuscirosea TaxID=1291556 RepID=UPI0037155596
MIYTTHGLMTASDVQDYQREAREAAPETGEDCHDCHAKGTQRCRPGCPALVSWATA